MQCSLRTVDLDVGISYRALSYAWKLSWSPRRRYAGFREHFYIMLGVWKVEIGENLFEALSQLSKRTSSPQSLWVDAICIDQRDKAEVNHQVRLMKYIYSYASTVIIWLGVADDTSDAVFEAIRRVADGAAPQGLLHIGSQGAHGLKRLLSRDWWTRLWVVQEVTLGKRCIVQCGAATIDFSDMVKVLGKLAEVVEGLENGSFTKALANALESDLEGLDRIVSIFEETRDLSDCPWAGQDVLTLLSNTSECDASNPRDYIYGVLGLLPKSVGIEPKYEASVAEVFEAAAMRIMQWTGSMQVLRGIDPRSGTGLQWPSWVPAFHKSWSCALPQSIPRVGLNSVVTSSGNGELQATARLLDRVEAVGDCCPTLDAGYQYNRTRLEVCRQTLGAWWVIMEEQFPLRLDNNIERKFWQLLLLPYGDVHPVNDLAGKDSDHDIPSAPANLAASDSFTSNSAIHLMHQWLKTGARPSDEEGTFSKSLLDLSALVSDARFFVTHDRRIGLTSAETKVGDRVALLGDVEEPFVLRAAGGTTQSNTYAIVALCHGMELVDSEGGDESVFPKQDRATAVMLDLLQASEVCNSNAFFRTVRVHWPGNENLNVCLDRWHSVRTAVLEHAHVEGETLRYCSNDPRRAAYMRRQVQEESPLG